jgi:hypothetical protein
MSVFGRYQQLRQQQFQPTINRAAVLPRMVTTDVQTTEDIPALKLPVEERRLLDSLPKTVRRKGKILLEHIKDKKNEFQWLDSGELLVDGNPVPGSNITDLIHHVTRKRPTATPPKGVDEFVELLDKTNVPKEALNLSEGAFQTPPQATAAVGTSFSPLEASTPKARKLPHQQRFKAPPPLASLTKQKRVRQQPSRFGNWVRY